MHKTSKSSAYLGLEVAAADADDVAEFGPERCPMWLGGTIQLSANAGYIQHGRSFPFSDSPLAHRAQRQSLVLFHNSPSARLLNIIWRHTLYMVAQD